MWYAVNTDAAHFKKHDTNSHVHDSISTINSCSVSKPNTSIAFAASSVNLSSSQPDDNDDNNDNKKKHQRQIKKEAIEMRSVGIKKCHQQHITVIIISVATIRQRKGITETPSHKCWKLVLKL